MFEKNKFYKIYYQLPAKPHRKNKIMFRVKTEQGSTVISKSKIESNIKMTVVEGHVVEEIKRIEISEIFDKLK